MANPGLAVVQHIATVAALQLTMRRHEEEILRREGAETLADLLQRDHPPEAIARRMVRAGFDPDWRLQLVVVRSASGLVEDDQVVRALADAGLPHLLLNTRETTYLLTRAGPQARAILGTLPELRAGASRPFAVGTQLGLPRREALWAAARAEDAGLPFVRYGSDAIGRWTVEDRGSLRSLVGSVLGAAQDTTGSTKASLCVRFRPGSSGSDRRDQRPGPYRSTPTPLPTGCDGSRRSAAATSAPPPISPNSGSPCARSGT